MHMVHESASKGIAVVGVYLDVGVTLSQPARSIKRRGRTYNIDGAETSATALFDTIFASANAILAPGTKTTIGPLSMSGLLSSLQAGEFQA